MFEGGWMDESWEWEFNICLVSAVHCQFRSSFAFDLINISSLLSKLHKIKHFSPVPSENSIFLMFLHPLACRARNPYTKSGRWSYVNKLPLPLLFAVIWATAKSSFSFSSKTFFLRCKQISGKVKWCREKIGTSKKRRPVEVKKVDR